jgi:hypothetical protein
MKPDIQWPVIMLALIAAILMFSPGAMASSETLVLSVKPALQGTTTTATLSMENVEDIETLSLELSFAAGSALALPAADWFVRDGYLPQSPFGTAPTVELNHFQAASSGSKVYVSGFDPSGSTGKIGQILFNVNSGAAEGDTQVLSLSGKYFSRSEQIVKTLPPVSAVFTVGALPDIVSVPTLKLFNPVEVGKQSMPQSVVLKNTGIADLVIGTLYISGTNASEFSIANDLCSGRTLAPGEQATVGIIFSPLSDGVKVANLFVPTNDPDTETLSVSLKMTGDVSDNEIPGDVDGNGIISTEDVFITLDVLTGGDSSAVFTDTFDIDGDGKLGINEAIYLLKQYESLSH